MHDTKGSNIDKEMVQKESVKGSIRSVRAGPWLVKRTTKDGRVVTRHRHPSDQERKRNRTREQNRRSVSRNIFSGLRAYGNYNLPENANMLDLLKALCEEAGWQVEEDGTVCRKKVAHDGGGCYTGDRYRMESTHETKTNFPEVAQEGHNINLELSL